MKCCECGKNIEVGDKVYAGIDIVWHTSCGEGACYAIMGGDMKLRWAGGGCVAGSLYQLLRNQERFE